MKEIKSYKEVFDSERGSKDLMSYGEGWKNFDEDKLTFLGD